MLESLALCTGLNITGQNLPVLDIKPKQAAEAPSLGGHGVIPFPLDLEILGRVTEVRQPVCYCSRPPLSSYLEGSQELVLSPGGPNSPPLHLPSARALRN